MKKLIPIISIFIIAILGISCNKKEVKPYKELEFFWREAYLEDNRAAFIAFDSIIKRAKGSYSYSQYNFEATNDNKLISSKITYYYTYGQGVTSSNITKDTFNLEYSKTSTKQGGLFTQDNRSYSVIRVSKVSSIYTSFYQREMGRDGKYVGVNSRNK